MSVDIVISAPGNQKKVTIKTKKKTKIFIGAKAKNIIKKLNSM